MTSLLTVAECQALVITRLSTANLQALIDRIEKIIENKIGAYQVDANTVSITETVEGKGEHIFLKVPFSTIVSITEDGSLMDAEDYQEWGKSGMVQRLPEGESFGDVCVVVYKPVDQREERKQAALELVRLYAERTAMVSESIAGEYSFNAPDWDKAIKRELKNLSFLEV